MREPREPLAFIVTLLLAFPAAGAIGFVVHERIGVSEAALFIVIAMVYVTLARGRLIGSSVMIHESQYPRVFAIVKRACAALEIPMPLIFVREDYNVPVAALGFGEPYSLVLSSHWIEHFQDDELAFIVGRQLGHIAAGHTRYLSLLSINGNENAIVSLIFGAWLRTCDFTCDRIGLLVCGSLDAASRAIAVSSFHHFGRQVDVTQFAEQGREIARDPLLKWGEWLGGEPYATRRIAAMAQFQNSHLYRTAEDWFLRDVSPEPPRLAQAGSIHVQREDCAGWWRRFIALAIDLVVVTALLGAFTHDETKPPSEVIVNNAAPTTAPARTPAPKKRNERDWQFGGFNLAGVTLDVNGARITGDGPLAQGVRAASAYTGVGQGAPFWLAAIYLAVLVTLAGQSFGMMITGLRVVRTDFGRAGFWRSAWRYAIALTLWPFILALSVVTHRVMLHDRWSGTRLITAERAMARALTAPVA